MVSGRLPVMLERTYLIQQSVDGRRNNAHNTLLANIALRQGNTRLAKVAQSTLLHNGEDLLPARLGLLVEGDAEQPIALRVGRAHSNGLAADMELNKVLGEVGSVAAAGTFVLIGV